MWNGSNNTQIQGQYYWRSRPLAFHKNGQVHFQHQDWLGTERLRTSYNGSAEATFTSLPFGDGQTASGSDLDPYHFAMLDSDSESGTDHAQFRQYNPTQGRWMRPDPYTGSYNFSNPQSFNRYVYALNNPLGLVDPLGLDCSLAKPGHGGARAMDDGDCGDPCGDDSCIPFDGGDPVDGGGDGSGDDPGQTTTADCDNGNCQSSTTIDVNDQPVDPPALPPNIVLTLLSYGAVGDGGGGGSAPSTNNPLKKWPLNGNLTPVTYQQDQKCSAGPVIGPIMDSIPGVLDACQWHDNKYIEYNCNATSWLSPFPGACKAINYILLIKVYNALPKPF